MSHITADNLRALTDAVETPMKYPVRGSAKAWVNFNGTGTVAIRESLNISSLTDNGTGDFTKNFTTSFSVATYLTTGSAGNGANVLTPNNAQATGSYRVSTFASTTGTSGDPVYANVLSMGTLA